MSESIQNATDITEVEGYGISENTNEYKNLNFIKALVGVIITPVETLRNILHKPKVLAIFLVVALSQTVFLALRFDLFSQYTKEKVRQAYNILIEKGNLQVTQEQVNAAIESSPVQSLISMPFGSLMVWVLVTLFIFAVVKLLRGKGTLKQFFCLTGYAHAPYLLGYLIVGLMSLFTANLYIEASFTSLLFFIPEDINPFVKGFIKDIEIFTIWKYVIIAIGLGMISKLEKKVVYGAVIFVYVTALILSGINQYMVSIYS
ncbi:MAG: YIP1 family protein [Clostridiaceae bacterium]|nr:YIP1 family protein [Clostridiaceae bacterium]